MTQYIWYPKISNVKGLLCLLSAIVFVPATWAQTSACDLNSDGAVNVVDVQLATNMTLGISSCTANVYGSNTCNVIVIQRVTNAALGGSCVTGTGTTSHSVALSWQASTSSGVTGYNVYRGTVSGGPYTKITSSTVSGLGYTDNNVTSGQTYYYVATAVDSSSNESAYSNQATAAVPNP